MGEVEKAAKDRVSRSNMNYFFCGVVEFRGLQDALATACGRPAETLCYDCGTSLCVNHTQQGGWGAASPSWPLFVDPRNENWV